MNSHVQRYLLERSVVLNAWFSRPVWPILTAWLSGPGRYLKNNLNLKDSFKHVEVARLNEPFRLGKHCMSKDRSPGRTSGVRAPGVRVAEHADDPLGQSLVDLPVPRDRLGDAGRGVPVPVVLGTVPHQLAPESLDRPDQINALHGTTNSPTFRVPGMCPPDRSK